MDHLLGHRLLSGVAILAAVLVLSATLAYRNLVALREDAQWVSHTHDVLEAAERTVNALVDAETGERGYIIAGDVSFLGPYTAASMHLKEELTRLRALSADNDAQQRRLTEIATLTERRFALLENAIALQRQGNAPAARLIVTSAEGRPLMDQIRRIVGEFRTEETRLLQIREEQTRRQYRLTVVMLFAGTLAGLAVLALFAWVMQRRLKERAQAAIALAEQREWFRTTLASIGDAVITTDLQGNISYQNSVAQALTGWHETEATGKPLASVFHIVNEHTREPADNPALRALREGRIVGLANHTVLIARSGAEIPIDDAAAPIRNDQGDISGVVLIFRDITESRKAQHELAASEARFRQLAETIPHMIWVSDATGRIEYANSRYRAYFGWTNDESVRRETETILSKAPADHLDEVRRRWDAALSTGEEFACEIPLQRVDGVWRWHLIRSAAMHDVSSNVTKWFGSATDIHEQRLLQVRLAAEDRRKDEFLAVLAHELRNPLAPLRNALDILKIDGSLSASVQQMRELMGRQLRLLVRLVDDLLDVSRIRQGKITLHLAPLNLTDVLQLAVEASLPLFDANAQRFNFLAPDQPVVVLGDETRLTQVFQNLLNNASKFTPKGGAIELSIQLSANAVIIRVRDTGQGISAEELSQLFELFSQGPRSPDDPVRQGLGIGLYLAKRLIEMHAGQLSATSPGIGQGSVFSVTLPTTDGAPTQARDDGIKLPLVKRWQILIVDDNVDAADTLAVVLSARGYKTFVAYDGPNALRLAEEVKPEVVLLDIGMPGMDGYAVARFLREIYGLWSTLIIAQTGWGQQRDRERSGEAGFDHHLVKPIDIDELERLLLSGRPTV